MGRISHSIWNVKLASFLSVFDKVGLVIKGESFKCTKNPERSATDLARPTSVMLFKSISLITGGSSPFLDLDVFSFLSFVSCFFFSCFLICVLKFVSHTVEGNLLVTSLKRLAQGGF